MSKSNPKVISEFVIHLLTKNSPEWMSSMNFEITDPTQTQSDDTFKSLPLFSLSKYLRENMEIVFNSSSKRIFKHETIANAIIDIIPTDSLLNFRSTDQKSFLRLMITYARVNSIWKLLKKILPKDSPDDVAKVRLGKILEKDEEGLSILDYSFLAKKYVVTDYISGVYNKVYKGDASQSKLSFPKLVKVNLRGVEKPKEVVQKEIEYMKNLEKYLKKFGGDLPEDKKVNNRAFEGLGDEELSPYSKILESEEGVELLKRMDELTEKLRLYQKGLIKDFTCDLEQVKKVQVGTMEENNPGMDGKLDPEIGYQRPEYFFSIKSFKFPMVYVDTKEKLQQAADELRSQILIAFDVEFCSLEKQSIPESKKIRSLAASVQLSSIDKSYFLDCIKLSKEIKILFKEIFENPKIIKVFHSPEGDIYTIYQAFDSIINNVCDTARCARLKDSLRQTPSLKRLTKEIVDLEVDKTYQSANWRIRPLNSDMIEYGISDAFLLLPLFKHYYDWILSEKSRDRGFELKVWSKCNWISKWFKPLLDYSIEYEVFTEEESPQ